MPGAFARRRGRHFGRPWRARTRSIRFSSLNCSRSSSAKTRGTWTCSWKRFSSTASISGTTAFPSALRLATIEFAILDMLGRIANKSMGQLIGDIHHREVAVYQATEYREKSVEESLDLIKRDVAEYNANAAQNQNRRAHVHDHRYQCRRPQRTNGNDDSPCPEDLWRSDGLVCGCEWVLLGRGSDPRRPAAGGIPVRVL